MCDRELCIGLKLKRQAKKIHESAVEINDQLPKYASAQQVPRESVGIK